LDLLRHHRALRHGHSDLSSPLDNEDSQTYFRRIGGEELFERVFRPGLNGPWAARWNVFRVIPMQVTWNLLVRGQWNLTDGVDRIPETAATQVRVLTKLESCMSNNGENGVHVDAEFQGKPRRFRNARRDFRDSRTACATLCPGLPQDMRETLSRTHIRESQTWRWRFPSRPIPLPGYAFTQDVVPGAEIEMEHLARAEPLSPRQRGMASVFSRNTPEKHRLDGEMPAQTTSAEIVEQNFPGMPRQSAFRAFDSLEYRHRTISTGQIGAR